jgi:YD repeat-containing protein
LNKGQQRLRERRYAYDAGGNLTQIADAQRGSTTYDYDPLGQLLAAVQPNLTETFAFDPAGNLLDAAKVAVNDASRMPADLNGLSEQPLPGSTSPRKLAKVTTCCSSIWAIPTTTMCKATPCASACA